MHFLKIILFKLSCLLLSTSCQTGDVTADHGSEAYGPSMSIMLSAGIGDDVIKSVTDSLNTYFYTIRSPILEKEFQEGIDLAVEKGKEKANESNNPISQDQLDKLIKYAEQKAKDIINSL